VVELGEVATIKARAHSTLSFPGKRTAADLLSLLFLQREIEQPNEEVLAKLDDVVEAVKEYARSFPFQLRAIVGRTLKAFCRMPDYGFSQ
jgi:hypothetical protein